MAHFKRSLSALLAVLMVFTTMSVAFTVISSAAVPRVPSENPKVIFSVPPYLQSQGDGPTQRGKKILGGAEISLRVPGGATNLSLVSNVSGITADGPVEGDNYEYTWVVNDGSLPNDPTAASTVRWAATYRASDGQTYTTYAWSAIRLNYNNPGLATNLKNAKTAAAYDSFNQHIEEIMPVAGHQVSAPDSHYTTVIPNVGAFNYISDPEYGMGTATYWADNYSTDDKSVDSAATPGGDIYVDISQVSDLSDLSLQLKTAMAQYAVRDDSGEDHHKSWYEGTDIIQQSINGGTTHNFSVSNSDTGRMYAGQIASSPFYGSLTDGVQAGDTIVIKPKVHWQSKAAQALGFIGYDLKMDVYQAYTITIHTYNKTVLKAALDDANQLNYQERQMYETRPDYLSDPGGKFRSWSQYMAALETAWAVYGRDTSTQTQIDNAAAALRACFAQYNTDNPTIWVSGMVYAPADYAAVDAIDQTAPDDFAITYDDRTPGLYYKYSTAYLLNAARADIASDRSEDHPLDARYQNVVNQMKNNLNAAINAVVEGGYKNAYVHFNGNGGDSAVSNVPMDVESSLFGRAYAPADVPTRQYYSFTGWFYDAEMTKPVTWPVSMDPSRDYFCGNLQSKSDSVGVAVNVYAGWALSGRTLSFDSMGGSPIDQVIGGTGEGFTPTDAQVPTKTGYVFECWCTDNTLQTEVDWSSFTFGKYGIVFARYHKATIYVTFNGNGGTFPNGGQTTFVSGLYEDPVTLPKPPAKDGFAFIGWGTTNNTTVEDALFLDDYIFPDSNTVFYAVWSSDYCNYTVDYNDGSEPMMYSVRKNNRINRPGDPPEREGYTRGAKWYFDPELTRQITFPYTVTENFTMYYYWKPKRSTITFHPNGGTMSEEFNAELYVNMPVGSELVFPEPPTLDGYIFAGWGLTDIATPDEAVTFTTVPVSSLTLFAIWAEEPPTAKFRLETDVDGTTVKRGQIINVTVYLSANFIVSSNSFMVFYDNRFFVPAINGEEFTTRTAGPTACTKEKNGNAFFKIIRNRGGNVTDCATTQNPPTGRVNTGTENAKQFFPDGWAESTSKLKAEYDKYRNVYFSAADVPAGKRMQPTNEQGIATFQLKVRDEAPLVDGQSDNASIFMVPEFNRTDNNYGKLLACRETQTEWDAEVYYDCLYNVTNPEYHFAVEEQEKVQISFNTKGGNSMIPVRVPIGTTYTPETPTRQSYTFLGWSFVDSDTAQTFKSFTVPEEDAVLYAHWVGNSVNYTVIHHYQNLEGGYDRETQTLLAQVGTVVYAQARPRDGFQDPDSAFGEVTESPALVLDLYYDRKITQVTLDATGGYFGNDPTMTTVALPSGMYGTELTNTAGTPTREGYDFIGWKYNNATYTFSTYPADDITVTAAWKAKSYTIQFYLNGSLYTTITKAYGTAITAPGVNPGEGQIFSGWASSTGEPFNYTTMPANPISKFYGTLRSSGMQLTLAILTKVNGRYTVTESYVALEAPEGSLITQDMLGYTTPEGYLPVVWRTGEAETSAPVSFPMTLSEDTTIYGMLKPKSVTITMMYSVFGGEYEFYADVYGKYGETYDREPDPEGFSTDKYAFKGWYLDEELTQLYEWPDTLPASDVTVYGKIYERAGKITFDANGAEEGTPPADITSPLGTTVTLPGAGSLAYPYYKFSGWATSPTGTPVTTVRIINESTMKMYAIWTANYATLNYDLNGADSGTKPANQRVELNKAFTSFPSGDDLVRDGFIFLGWADTANAKEALTSYTATSTGNKTLYAVWAALSVDLVAVEGSTTVIDNDKKIIYGLCTEATREILDNYLAVEGNGHLEYDTEQMIMGTGTQVRLVNDYSGNTDAVYTIIVFGDVNCDGVINNLDKTLMKSYVVGSVVPEVGSPEFYAADMNGDGEINQFDMNVMKSVVIGASTLHQATRELIPV